MVGKGCRLWPNSHLFVDAMPHKLGSYKLSSSAYRRAGQVMDDIKNLSSPPFKYHGPGLASGDVAEDGIALAPPAGGQIGQRGMLVCQGLFSDWPRLLQNLFSFGWIQ